MHKLALVVFLLVLALSLRVVNLSSYPAGFTPDEASFGYDAYSILKTGKDQWGETLPLTLRSFGDFKLPLYAYITIPSVAIFGLNEFATRLPNAIIGTLAVLATYLLTKELFQGSKFEIRNLKLEIITSFLLAISPWHIALSRGAFEANLTTFFMPLGIWAFYKGLKNPRWMVVSAVSLGLNMFSYHSARFLTPLLLILLVFIFRKSLQPQKYKSALAVFGVFVFGMFYTLFGGATSRGADIAIFNPTDNWLAVADRRYEAVLAGFPDFLSRLFSNKVVYVAKTFLSNYSTYLSPQFLLTQGAGEWTYGMIPGRGVLYLVEAPFLLFALLQVAQGKAPKNLLVVFLWILLSPIPSALTKGPGYAGNRVAIMMPALQILSAYGALLFVNFAGRLKKGIKPRLTYSLLVLLLLSLTFFLEDYRFHAPKNASQSMLYGRREALIFAESVESKYSTILLSRSVSEPQIYVAFYKKWDPTNYQSTSMDWMRYQEEGLSFLDQLGTYSLGKYLFQNISYSVDRNRENTLLIGKPGEFPKEANIIKRIDYQNGTPALYIVDPANVYAQK